MQSRQHWCLAHLARIDWTEWCHAGELDCGAIIWLSTSTIYLLGVTLSTITPCFQLLCACWGWPLTRIGSTMTIGVRGLALLS